MFSLLQFRVLAVVADEKNLSEAATKLGRTPSAVSMILKQLEERLGGKLFVDTRKDELTELGKYVLNHGEQLLRHHDAASKAIVSFANGNVGEVTFACVPSISIGFLPTVLSRLWAQHPRIKVNVTDIDSRSASTLAANGAVEFALASMPRANEPVDFEPLFTDALDIVCSADDDICRHKGPVDWSDLEGRSFLANATHQLITTPSFAALVAQQKAYIPNIVSLLSLVKSGVGVTVLPRLSSFMSPKGVRFLPAEDRTSSRTVGILCRRGRPLSPAAQTFVGVLKEVILDEADKYGVQYCFQTQTRETRPARNVRARSGSAGNPAMTVPRFQKRN